MALQADSDTEEGGGLPLLLIAAPVVLVLLLVVYFVVFKKKGSSQRGSKVLLCGVSGGGKTALLSRLHDGEWRDTVSSYVPTEVTCTFSADGREVAMPVVDLPGHDALRHRLTTLVREAAAVVVVVDATTCLQHVSENASFLYDILVNNDANEAETPIVVACNKSDLLTASSAAAIEVALADELNKLRETRSAMVDTEGEEDEEEKESIFLGYRDSKFTFKDVPMPVSFEACSARSNDLVRVSQAVLDARS
eukprot:TRINITY_DN5558_c0_g1_i1.p1 TRINITY_DN5558_c0_g1~~TRINITY_DN5558_c0_g1_i1.p1  ORF type:complete len:251 (-),score=68.92 TRINITY_DN5558_c0_g1_i1:74-826(-)